MKANEPEPQNPKTQLRADEIIRDLGDKPFEGTGDAEKKNISPKNNNLLISNLSVLKRDTFIDQLTKVPANDPMFELKTSLKVNLKDVLKIIWNVGMFMEK